MKGSKNKNRTTNKYSLPAHPPANTVRVNTYRWALPAILVVTALLYTRALANGFTSLDDDYYILKNPLLKDGSLHGIVTLFTSFYSYNYHPLTLLSYLAEYTLFALNPLPYHAFNVALHLLNTWLVYKFTERLSRQSIAAIVTSLLFAIHPLHVESVAWIAERKDLLYTFFYLSALIYYLRYSENGFQKKDCALSLLLFLGSLLSKSAAVTLPVLLLAIDWYRGRGINKRSILEKAPFFALSLVFGVINIIAQTSGGALNNEIIHTGFINHIFLFTYAVSFYLVKLLVPTGLCAMHYFPSLNGGLPVLYYASLPALILACFLVARTGARRRDILFGFSFFVITISVMLQVIAVGATITAERYTYMPYIGLFFIAGKLAAGLPPKWAKPAAIAFGLYVAGLCFLTWVRIGVWNNDQVLFADIGANYPGAYRMYYDKANNKMKQSHLREAMQFYDVTLLLNPGFTEAYLHRAQLHDVMGDLRAAIQDYSLAIRDSPTAEAFNSRATDYSKTGNPSAAMADLDTAITLKPRYAEALNNRGWIHYQGGDMNAAMTDYRRALAADTAFSMAYNNIGWAYYQGNKMDSALLYFDKAIACRSDNSLAIANRAAIEANSGGLGDALADYNRLLQLEPASDIAYLNRGLVYFRMKDTVKARADWQKSAGMGNKNAANLLR